MTYRVTLTNAESLRLTLVVQPPINEQPDETAARIANNDPEHRRYGPWVAGNCDRAS